jgi:hypothetical protein
MFEITSEDIASLADDDLRTLVGLLCEAELRRLDLPRSAVTWGGHQDAADSGIDVRVALLAKASIKGFVPRPATGFQVKKPDMPRGKILEEMRPSGTIRPVIRELADESGAYIIVSSTGSTSQSALRNRRNAMKEAVSDVPNGALLMLDFYDRTRLATWVRDHPGLIAWVRQRAGRVIAGWHSYGAWAHPSEGVSGEYLLDGKSRILTGRKEDGEGLAALEGIKRMRDLLRQPGKVVRLIGLSGVGKTRLVQALFDERIGEQALDPSLAFYTNMADSPDPQPTALASYLTVSRIRAILVVDNCAPDLHRRLSDVCRQSGSTVGVITVEYDIREDQPEATEVLELVPASVELVEKLLQRRFPEISPIDARTIAEFSGGNARIAVALANTVGKEESIAGLKDEELFRRLFFQRHDPSESLVQTAQACSLVYSFQGEDLTGNKAELPRLGELVGKRAEQVYQDVAELRRRDLVQQRGDWRAVLPHAIANRLAAMALENIPWAVVEAQLLDKAPERLLKSFSRRLGYLHNSKEAVQIAEKLLEADSWLGNVAQLNPLGRAMFEYVAPAVPEAALVALERACNGPDHEQMLSISRDFVGLLRSFAYDPKLFDRSVALLITFAEVADDDKHNDAAKVFESLFFIYLSGTHAPIEQRLRVIDALLRSRVPKHQKLGLDALRAVLEAWHFMSAHSFEFGAHSRDFGYRPKTDAELQHWFASALRLVEAFACSHESIASDVREVLGEKFRGLWTKAGIYDDLERISLGISSKLFWREGWISVRETLTYDSKSMDPYVHERLVTLAQRLRPKDLVQKVRSIVLTSKAVGLDLSNDADHADDPIKAYVHVEKIAEALGKETAQDRESLGQLFPELIGTEGRLWFFGRGLAAGAEEPEAMWKRFVAQLAATKQEKRDVQVFRGFLNGLMDIKPHLANAILDDAVEDEVLAYWFPVLQTSVTIDERGLYRLNRALARGKAPIHMFRRLAWGRVLESVSGADFSRLVSAIANLPDGYDVALEILSMRLHLDKHEKRDHEREVVELGQQLLHQVVFKRNQHQDDYRLGEIAEGCLTGERGASLARDIGRKLRHAVAKLETSAFDNAHFTQKLLKVQPSAALDAFLAGAEEERRQGIRALQEMSEHQTAPVDGVQESDLFQWCDRDPTTRYPTIAAVATLFHRADKDRPLDWTKVALGIVERAPDRGAVLKEYVRRFNPRIWSGSHAAVVEARAKLLNQFDGHPDAAVVEYIAKEKIRLAQQIERERQQEYQEDRAKDERFE